MQEIRISKEKLTEIAEFAALAEAVFSDREMANGMLETVKILLGKERYRSDFLPIWRKVIRQKHAEMSATRA